MIESLDYEQILFFWKNFLWKERVTPIERTSFMLNGGGYAEKVGDPLFYGFRLSGQIVGVNSMHMVNGTLRSRGLWVFEKNRNQGIGKKLLEHCLNFAQEIGVCAWSYPKKEALSVYTSAGFVKTSNFIIDEVDNKINCFVTSKI